MNMLRFSGLKCLLILSILCYLTRPVLSDCQDPATFDPNFDYFPDKAVFSHKISVTYQKNYIILNNEAASEVYVLYCTAAQPTVTNIPANSTYYQVPVKNVAVADPSIVSFIEILGEESSLKYVSDKSKITSPCLQKNNALYENMNFQNTTQVSSVSVIFTSSPLQKGGNFVTVPFDDEMLALKKAEWIKFISLFYNKISVANDAFDKINNNYQCHVNNLSEVPNQTKKTIAWVAIEADSTFTVEFASFYTNVTLDAGAFPLNPQITTDLSVDDLHQAIADSYIVIDRSDLIAPNNTLDAWKHYFGYDQTSNLPRFLTEKRLYRTQKLLNSNGYDDWSERSASRPDLVLQDLIAIQYPLYQKDYIVNWFDKFAETGDSDIISQDKCDDKSFGQPKTDFGTCTPKKFLGDGKANNGTQIIDVGGSDDGNHNDNNDNKDNKNNDEKKSNVKPGVVIAVALTGTLVVFGLGAWLIVIARRKYRERFVKLRDEPVVQMSSVKDVKEVAELAEVKETK